MLAKKPPTFQAVLRSGEPQLQRRQPVLNLTLQAGLAGGNTIHPALCMVQEGGEPSSEGRHMNWRCCCT